MQRSAGIMVNYLYRLADLEKNHETYSRDYQVVAASEIETLSKRAETKKLAI
jgi:malonyl-CoA decarboxylase